MRLVPGPGVITWKRGSWISYMMGLVPSALGDVLGNNGTVEFVEFLVFSLNLVYVMCVYCLVEW